MRCNVQFYETWTKQFGRDYGSDIRNPLKLLDYGRKAANYGEKLVEGSKAGFIDVTDDHDRQECDDFEPIAYDKYKRLFCNGYPCNVSLSGDNVRKFLDNIQSEPNYPGKAPPADSPLKKVLQDRGLWQDRKIYPDTDVFIQRLYNRAHDAGSFFD